MRKISMMEAWLSEVAKSKDTRENYKKIQRFLKLCNCTLEDIQKEWDDVTTYREEKMFKKKWTRKIKQYKANLNLDGNLTEGSVETYMTPISSFFQYLETPIKVKKRSVSVVYHNRDILREEIDSIISNTPHIRDKTFFFMLAQTGLRPVVLSRLQYRDIKGDWEKKIVPCKINVPKNKNKGEYKEHYTFMPQESIDILGKYFDYRFGKGNNPKDDDLLFSQSNTENISLNTDSESNIFSRVALKLGIAERKQKGKPKAIRMYNLRKFFRNNITNSSEVDTVDCHFFMGHKLNMNDEHYFSTQNIEKFRSKFDKGSEHIKISGVPDTHKEKVRYLEAKLTQTEIELETLRKKVQYLLSPEYLNKRIHEEVEKIMKQVEKENPEME